jgi:hypothetical protein
MPNKPAATELYENLWFTHKVHEKQAWIYSASSAFVKIMNVALISTVLLLQFIQLIKPELSCAGYWSLGFAVLEVGFAVFQLSFNYETQGEQHRMVAKKLCSAKNNMLIMKEKKNAHVDLENMVTRLNEIYEQAPQTGWFAKKLADREWNKEHKKTVP